MFTVFLIQYLVHVYPYDQFKMLCTTCFLVEYLYNGMKIDNSYFTHWYKVVRKNCFFICTFASIWFAPTRIYVCINSWNLSVNFVIIVHVIACCLFGSSLLLTLMMVYWQLCPIRWTCETVKFSSKYKLFKYKETFSTSDIIKYYFLMRDLLQST